MTDEVKIMFVPIWLVESEIDSDLPTERAYHPAGDGEPIGHIAIPDNLNADLFGDCLRLATDPVKPGGYMLHVATLSIGRAIRAAIRGEYGLSWQAKAGADAIAEPRP